MTSDTFYTDDYLVSMSDDSCLHEVGPRPGCQDPGYWLQVQHCKNQERNMQEE